MASSAAGHAVLYAVRKYGISDLVTDADKQRAQDDVYKFLSWKLGNPAATAATWLDAGYQHFDRGYSDEAGASLLGFNLPGDGSEDLYLPDWFVNLRLKIFEEAVIPIAAKALEAEYGIPAALSESLLNMYFREEAKVLKRVGINIPKKYDYDNCLLELMVDARRNPMQTRARLQATIDKAAGKKTDIPAVTKKRMFR